MGGTSPWYHFGSKSRYGLDMVVSSFLKMGRFVLRQVCWFPLCRMERQRVPLCTFFERNTHSQVYFSSAASGAQSSVAITAQPVPKRSGMRTSPQYTGTVCVYAFSTAMASNRRFLGNSPAVRTGNTGAPPPSVFTVVHKLRVGAVHSFSAKSRPFGQRFPVTDVTAPFSTSVCKRQPLGQTMQVNSRLMCPPPPSRM